MILVVLFCINSAFAGQIVKREGKNIMNFYRKIPI